MIQIVIAAAAASCLLSSSSFIASVEGLSCEISNCASIVHPLLKDPRYIIPSNTEEVDYICNTLFPQTWSNFVDCIKDYSTNCMNQDERIDINRAIGDSINSVHKICTNVAYREEYFQYASCIRERISEEFHCKGHYNKLVASVNDERNKTQLCCNHHLFKECLIQRSESCCPTCDDPATVPSQYARMFLDKALGFVLKECNKAGYPATSCALDSEVLVSASPSSSSSSSSSQQQQQQQQSHYDGPNYFPSGGRDPRQHQPTSETTIDTTRFKESLQPLTEWIDEEKVEEFNEFLDNQLQEKLGRGFNSAAGSSPSRLSKCAVLVLASSVMVAAIISSLSI